MNPIETAYNWGREYAQQIASDPYNHQNGPGRMSSTDDIPDGDYVELKRAFGTVTPEIEGAYRDGYNSL